MTFIQLIKSKGYTYSSLAKKLDVSRETVRLWSAGTYTPTENYKRALCDLLDISYTDLMDILVKEKHYVPLRYLFKKHGYSMKDIAQELGTNTCTVGSWAYQRHVPRHATLLKLSELLGEPTETIVEAILYPMERMNEKAN